MATSMAVTVDVAHHLLESVLGVEDFLACLAVFVGAQVGQRDLDAGVEVGELTHTARHDVPLEGGGGEDGGVWPELLASTALVGVADDAYGIEGLSLFVFLLVDLAIAEDL